MPFIEIKSGAVEVPDGVYPVTLVELKGPRTVTAQRGPKAGQDIQLIDWIFAIDDGDLDGTQIEAATSTASGPKSKMYAYLTALFNGKAPAIGSKFEPTDLQGRRALATIRTDESGWPRIENLGAMPASMQQTGFAQKTGAAVAATDSPAPAAASPQPLREAVAAGTGDDLPF